MLNCSIIVCFCVPHAYYKTFKREIVYIYQSALTMQREAIKAQTEGKCVVIDCYKRLPFSRSIKLLQNCIRRLKALC